MKLCTDIKQSKKLIELGVDVNTADMGWNVFVDNTIRLLPIDDWDLVKDGSGNVKFYPAWSLTTLLELIPPGNILLRDALSGKYKCINTVDSNLYDNPVDAAFEMVCWLLENKKL